MTHGRVWTTESPNFKEFCFCQSLDKTEEHLVTHNYFFSIFKCGKLWVVYIRIAGSQTQVLIFLDVTEYNAFQKQTGIIATIVISTPHKLQKAFPYKVAFEWGNTWKPVFWFLLPFNCCVTWGQLLNLLDSPFSRSAHPARAFTANALLQTWELGEPEDSSAVQRVQILNGTFC